MQATATDEVADGVVTVVAAVAEDGAVDRVIGATDEKKCVTIPVISNIILNFVARIESIMDTFMTWAKENYDLISLMVGLLGVGIAFISMIYEIKKKKKQKQKQ